MVMHWPLLALCFLIESPPNAESNAFKNGWYIWDKTWGRIGPMLKLYAHATINLTLGLFNQITGLGHNDMLCWFPKFSLKISISCFKYAKKIWGFSLVAADSVMDQALPAYPSAAGTEPAWKRKSTKIWHYCGCWGATCPSLFLICFVLLYHHVVCWSHVSDQFCLITHCWSAVSNLFLCNTLHRLWPIISLITQSFISCGDSLPGE